MNYFITNQKHFEVSVSDQPPESNLEPVEVTIHWSIEMLTKKHGVSGIHILINKVSGKLEDNHLYLTIDDLDEFSITNEIEISGWEIYPNNMEISLTNKSIIIR